MKGKLLVAAGLVVLVVMAGLTILFIAPAQATDEVPPEDVVRAFYDRYLSYIENDDGAMRNPLVDGMYHDCPELSEEFVTRIDELVSGNLRADPILLAQDVPVKVEVEEVELDGDGATVTVAMFWGGNPEPSQRLVRLERMDREWKIVTVTFD
jgi:hypothetical protein